MGEFRFGGLAEPANCSQELWSDCETEHSSTQEAGKRGRYLRIDKVDVVGAFQADKSAPLKLGVALARLAEANQGQIVPLTVPAAAPPNLPRFMVGMERIVLQVALDRVQLSLDPPDHIKGTPEEVFVYARAEVKRVLLPLLGEDWMQQPWAGVVLNVAFPVEDATQDEAAATAAMAMTRFAWVGEGLKSFQMQVGRLVNGFNRTFTITGYELRTAEFEWQPGGAPVEIGNHNSVLDESGIGVTVDINNRGQAERPPNSLGTLAVIDEASRALDTLIADLNLDRVLP